jgi:hypothetical protein
MVWNKTSFLLEAHEEEIKNNNIYFPMILYKVRPSPIIFQIYMTQMNR